MEIKNMTVEQIEARKAEIVTELDKPEADLDALQEEMRNLNAELEARKAAEAKKSDIRKMVASGSGHVVVAVEPAEKVETRNTKEYIDAYAKYVKTGDDKECRALLTENVSGTLPVPDFIDGIIRTAWENDAILSRVRKTAFKGNLKVPFERAADPAYEHGEGTTAITEEDISGALYTEGCPDPDLIVRTAGEQRLSNFLLWQAAYSEFYFTDTLWPDFDGRCVEDAINAYYKRTRRFGGLV